MKTKSYKNIKVGITFSTFDLFHAWHVKMIEEAKRQCDWEKVYKSVQKPAFVFDGRNILDNGSLSKIGFNYKSIGK